jgi:hypothetical protein
MSKGSDDVRKAVGYPRKCPKTYTMPAAVEDGKEETYSVCTSKERKCKKLGKTLYV